MMWKYSVVGVEAFGLLSCACAGMLASRAVARRTGRALDIIGRSCTAGAGALLALLLLKTDFSLVALLGLFLLIGVVMKNAILMIDVALQREREHGATPDEAIREACLLRQRAPLEPVEQRHAETADHPDLREVDVRVDEPGQQQPAVEVDDVVRYVEGGERATRDDHAVTHQQPLVRRRAKPAAREGVVGGVEHGRASRRPHQQRPPKRERVPVDIFNGETLTDEFARINPARTTPVLETEHGYLPESNAILLYLATGTPFLPEDSFERAQVARWLFYEQTDVIPTMGGLRFRLLGLETVDDRAGLLTRAAV